MPRLFVLIQHGSHGRLCDFDPLVRAIKAHFNYRLAFPPQAAVAAATTATRSSSSRGRGKAAASKKQQEDAAVDENDDHELCIWGSRANELIRTDAGTHTCVERLLAELVPKLTEFANQQNDKSNKTSKTNSNNSTNKIYFTCLAHSFGGIILREAVHRLFTTPALAAVMAHYTPLSFATVATPHCGCLSMNPVLTTVGSFLGKIYSSTYAELLLDSPLLETMARIPALAAAETTTNNEEEEKEEEETKPATTTRKRSQSGGRGKKTAAAATANAATEAASSRQPTHAEIYASFRHRLLCGNYSHDYLVRFETSTLLPSSAVPFEEHPKMDVVKIEEEAAATQLGERRRNRAGNGDDDDNDEEEAAESNKNKSTFKVKTIKSTHVGEMIHLPQLLADERTGQVTTRCKYHEAGFSQLTDDRSKGIAVQLRRQMHFNVVPVYVPYLVCIAHDAVMRKGLNSNSLPDVVDVVARQLVKEYFDELQ